MNDIGSVPRTKKQNQVQKNSFGNRDLLFPDLDIMVQEVRDFRNRSQLIYLQMIV